MTATSSIDIPIPVHSSLFRSTGSTGSTGSLKIQVQLYGQLQLAKDIGPFPVNGSKADIEEWKALKRKFESDKRPDKSKIPAAEHKAGWLKRMADRG